MGREFGRSNSLEGKMRIGVDFCSGRKRPFPLKNSKRGRARNVYSEGERVFKFAPEKRGGVYLLSFKPKKGKLSFGGEVEEVFPFFPGKRGKKR